MVVPSNSTLGAQRRDGTFSVVKRTDTKARFLAALSCQLFSRTLHAPSTQTRRAGRNVLILLTLPNFCYNARHETEDSL